MCVGILLWDYERCDYICSAFAYDWILVLKVTIITLIMQQMMLLHMYWRNEWNEMNEILKA